VAELEQLAGEHPGGEALYARVDVTDRDAVEAATFAPSRAKRRAVARPIPAAAPVTTTTLPSSPVSIILSSPRVVAVHGPKKETERLFGYFAPA